MELRGNLKKSEFTIIYQKTILRFPRFWPVHRLGPKTQIFRFFGQNFLKMLFQVFEFMKNRPQNRKLRGIPLIPRFGLRRQTGCMRA